MNGNLRIGTYQIYIFIIIIHANYFCRLLYWPQLVVDGNMKLVCLFTKRPEADVSLSDGELFMVKRVPYANHIANAPEWQPVCYREAIIQSYTNWKKKSKCNNHRAQNSGGLHQNHLDSTGKGACACARHGAFIPHCAVNFQKGERWEFYIIIIMEYLILQ